MINKISTKDMTRSQWLEERRKSVGGSEVGAVLGLNSYESPYSVWANKTGRLPDVEQNESMRQGTDLEEYVAKRFSDATGKKVERCNYIMRNDAYPHLHANIDRRVLNEQAGLECKTASAMSAKRFKGGEFPESYYAQCVSYMAVTGLPVWYLAVVVLGKEFKVFMMTTIRGIETPEWCESQVYVDPTEFGEMKKAVEEFWKYVERDEAPPADGSKATTEAIKDINADGYGDETVEMFDMGDVFRRWKNLKSEKECVDKGIAECENTIKDRLGENVKGEADEFTVTWKPSTRETLDRKKLEKAHPELDLTPYLKSSTSRRFILKERV